MLPFASGLISFALWTASPVWAAPANDATVPVQSPTVEPAGPPELPEEPTGAVTEPEAAPEPAEPAEPVPPPVEQEAPGAEAPPQPEPVAEVAPTVTPPVVSELDQMDLVPASEARGEWVKVQPPRWRGTGQFVAAGALFAWTFAYQIGDGLICGNCAVGVLERVWMAAGMGLAAGGGVVRGHADAYDDVATRRGPRDTRKALIAGATLTGVGAVLGLVNEGLWWRCGINGSGPYHIEDNFSFSNFDCRYGLSRSLLDLASASTAVGLGLLTWSLTYNKDAKAYARARVIGMRPTLGQGRMGLTLEGRF
ncbi:MAG: hypothetical protein AAF799_07925 [Myxococcota bacterium]